MQQDLLKAFSAFSYVICIWRYDWCFTTSARINWPIAYTDIVYVAITKCRCLELIVSMLNRYCSKIFEIKLEYCLLLQHGCGIW